MDEMPEVVQRFTADVESYVEEVARARDGAVELAAANDEVKRSAGGLRDKIAEAAVALKITRDEMGRLRDAEGKVITASEAQAMALGRIRDKALEAAFAMRELDKYQEKGRLSRLGSGIAGGIAGGIGSGIDALGSGSGLMSLNGVLGIIAAVMAIGPEVGALATGLLAAGAGVAAFGAVAIPNLTAASTAASKVQQAQDAYNVSIAHGVKQATAYKAEQIAIGKAYAELSPQQVQLSQQMGSLQGMWQKFVQANTGAVSKVLTQAVGIVGQLLPWLQQFANVATPVIGQMLTGLSKFIESPNFQYFMTFLSQLSGPALKAIGSGMEGLTIRVMQLFETFSQKDVINSINIAFRLLGAAVELVQGLVLEGMYLWDQLTAAQHKVARAFDLTRHWVAAFAHGVAADFDGIRHNTAQMAHDVAHWFDDVRHGIAELGHDWAVWFDRIRHTIAAWADNVVHFFEQLPGRIVHALGNLLNLLVQAGKDIIMGLLHGLQSAAGSVLNFLGNLAGQVKGVFGFVLGMASPSRVFYEHGRNTLLGYIAGLQAAAPAVRQALAAVGGQVATGGLPGIAGGYGGAIGAGGRMSVTVPLSVAFSGAASFLNDPHFLQFIQTVIQEAVLRYNVNNPGNGLAIATGGRGL